MTNTPRKVLMGTIGLGLVGAIGLFIVGSREYDEVETRYVGFNSQVGTTYTYNNAKNPRAVIIGGHGPLSGIGLDFDEDGDFDEVEKRDIDRLYNKFTLSDLEKGLNDVKARAKTDKDVRVFSHRMVRMENK